MTLTITTLLALIGTVLGSSVIAQFVTSFFQRKKVSAEAESMVAGQILQWAKVLTKRIELLEALLEEKNKVIRELQVRLARLEKTNGVK